MNLRFAIACFLVFFGLVESIQWLSHLALPFPLFVAGGLILAVMSNSDKLPPDKLPWSGLRDWRSSSTSPGSSQRIDPE